MKDLDTVLARLRATYDAELSQVPANVAGELSIVTDADALPRIERLHRFSGWLIEQGRGEEGARVTRDVRILVSALEKHGETERLHERLRRVEHAAFVTFAIPRIVRDKARQAGSKKPRGPKKPMLDAFVAANLDAGSNKAIWNRIPTERDDFANSGIYRDGDKIVEYDGDRLRGPAVGMSVFNDRVTAARKAKKNPG